jgi:cytochrome c peroxidase
VSTGIGGQQGHRKAPPIINLAVTLNPHFFWDGRAASLEEQALGPISNPLEMGHRTNR